MDPSVSSTTGTCPSVRDGGGAANFRGDPRAARAGDEEALDEEKGDVEAAERPVEGAAYSTVDVGQLKLRLLTSDVRKLNITATRHVPEEIPMPILALPSSHGPDSEEKGTRVEESEEEVKPPPERRATTEAAATSKPNAVKEPEEKKPQAKRQKATTSKKGSEHPAVARTTRST